jgi:glycosyltransferase involved in cell wall biosynthesis
MPTFGRQRFVPLAVEWFLRQDYEPRELIVVDDGHEPVGDLLPDDPRIRHLVLSTRHSIGAKRNLGAQEARGELIAHWDDDDWSAPRRLGYQVAALQTTGADVCGLSRLLYLELGGRRAWRYAWNGNREWVSDGTFMYTKNFWQSNPLPDTSMGLDCRLLWSSRQKRIAPLEDRGAAGRRFRALLRLVNRTILLNELIRERHARRYLEIGVGLEQENFAQIRCAEKVGVDPRSDATFRGTSNEFFARNGERFDVVFVDGEHTEAQVLADLGNALSCLAPGGVVVLHDCLPPDAWHQREPEAYVEGENWNGTVWKAVLRSFSESPYRCQIVDADWGCGIIDTRVPQTPRLDELPAELSYDRHYRLLEPYTVSEAEFFRERVTVFYHLACIGNWHDVLAEQVGQLADNHFEELNVSLLGSPNDRGQALAICAGAGIDATPVFESDDLSWFERPALLAVEAHAAANTGYVLYLHGKGVSNPGDAIKARWRRLMMDELIGQWEQCVVQLPHYDVIGVNWRHMPPISHFSGNFWYASTDYLGQLPRFSPFYDKPRYVIWDAINDKRLSCEFWLGASANAPRVLSLVCQDVDFCSPDFWRELGSASPILEAVMSE